MLYYWLYNMVAVGEISQADTPLFKLESCKPTQMCLNFVYTTLTELMVSFYDYAFATIYLYNHVIHQV